MTSWDLEPITPAVKPVHWFPNELKPFPDSLGERGQTNRLPVYLQHFTVGSWPCLKPNLSLLLRPRWDTLIPMKSDCLCNPKLSSVPEHPSSWISSKQPDVRSRGAECAPPDGARHSWCCTRFFSDWLHRQHPESARSSSIGHWFPLSLLAWAMIGII